MRAYAGSRLRSSLLQIVELVRLSQVGVEPRFAGQKDVGGMDITGQGDQPHFLAPLSWVGSLRRRWDTS